MDAQTVEQSVAIALNDPHLTARITAHLLASPTLSCPLLQLHRFFRQRFFRQRGRFAFMKSYFRNHTAFVCLAKEVTLYALPEYTYGDNAGSQYGYSPPPPPPRPRPNQANTSSANGSSSSALLRCVLCNNKTFRDHVALNQHKASGRHRIKVIASQLQDTGAYTANKGGVEVSELSEANVPEGQELKQILTIRNRSAADVVLLSFSLIKRSPSIQLLDSLGQTSESVAQRLLQRGTSIELDVVICPKALGLIRDVVHLEFDSFSIVRKVSAACEPDLGPGLPSIAPTAPYKLKPKPPVDRARNDQAVPGEQPRRLMTKWENPPKAHSPKPWLEKDLSSGRRDKVDELLSKISLVDPASYSYKMQVLLWIEELQHEVDIRQYDMENAQLTLRHGGLVGLEVPGLAENRPSVMKGDALYVTPPGGGKEWQGYVHRVERDEVQLKFHSLFHRCQAINSSRFSVRFSIKRSTFVFMQSAIARAKQTNVLNPCTLLGKRGLMLPEDQVSPTDFIRDQMSGMSFSGSSRPSSLLENGAEPIWSPSLNPLNEEQKTAVRAILRSEHAPMPYLVFGPPGTGKTNTMCEAAVQVLKRNPFTRILVSAPSNWAADLLATRMIGKWGAAAQSMYRVCAYSRNLNDVDAELIRKNCCNYDDDVQAFTMPSKGEIMKKRVVVVTCLMAAKLYALGIPQGHFTHIFIDEAGHAEEPLTLCPIAGLLAADSSARLIMAGDPCQLGPVILSKLAKQHGLDISTMERLISVEPYTLKDESSEYDVRYITKLRKNYRSHPKILELPNRLFYKNELEAAASPDITHSLLGFKGLPNASFPIIFHSVVGKDAREGNSPSWFNELEVKLVVKYVGELLDMRNNRPMPIDIGIISPFRKQVEKLRMLLRHKYSDQLKVGSTEEFQGQEKRIIIVSTVRSSAEHLEFDRRHSLGFLRNSKRFNVAMTRAKAMLIIIGNPAVLAHDPNWAEMLTFVAAHGGNTGSELPSFIVESAAAQREAGGAQYGARSSGSGRSAANVSGAAGLGCGAHSAAYTSEEASIDDMLARLNLVKDDDEADASHDHLTSGLQVEGGEMPRWE